jgi:hypothetical protein
MLRNDTQALWEQLRIEPALAGFVLVGGSALALHLRHRISEDLDFVYAGVHGQSADKLPRRRLDALYRQLHARGLRLENMDDPAAVDEFDSAGMDIGDHQQDLKIGAVNVSFFMPDTPLGLALRAGHRGGARLAELDELFASKALVAASRSKTRDWFDLYYLMTAGGYTIEDFAAVFTRCAQPLQLGIALNRLSSGQVNTSDEGFASLLEHPPSVEEMAAFFRGQRDRYEIWQGLQRLGSPVQQPKPRGRKR